MWYLNFFKRLTKWEEEFGERNGFAWTWGSPVYFLMGIVVPLTVMTIVAGDLEMFVEVNRQVFAVFLFGIPLVVAGLLMFFDYRDHDPTK